MGQQESGRADNIVAAGLMSASEVCAFFHIGKTTLYDWTARGLLQSTKIRGSRRWLRRSVHDCAAGHRNHDPVASIRGAS